MPEYTVKATITLNVETYVEADSEEQARSKAIHQIYNNDYEAKELESDPVIDWVEEL